MKFVLLVIFEKVENTIRTYTQKYELFPDMKNALMRKKQLLSLSFIKRVDIIELILDRMFSNATES